MRRIVKLKGEIVIFVIISIVIGWIGFAFISDKFFRNYSYDKKYSLAYNYNYDTISLMKEKIDRININNLSEAGIDNKLKEIIEQADNMRSSLYLTDKEGYVVYNTHILDIDRININADNVEISVSEDSNEYEVKNIIKITDNRYLVVINMGYCGDNGNVMDMFMLFIVIMLLFIFFIYGRVNYINKLNNSVESISKGDLSVRAPIKYKNELTSLAEGINSMTEELENRDSNEKEFITNISHDLRTPLTTIMGYIKMIQEKKYENSQELDKYINIIDRKSSYLNRMLEDFFYYSKVRSNDIKKENVRINLNESLMQILDGEEESFNKNNLKLDVSICRENLYLCADPMLIARTFQNIISNSLKYSKEGTTVNISLDNNVIDKKDYAIFKVSNIPYDDIKEQDAKKLFDRMYKMDKSRNNKGSGLGLSITKEIVRNYEGFTKAYLEGRYICFEIGFIINKNNA